ncbi:MAG: hypothetical protein K2L25_04595 [Alphaproteobacteria bacterium]|nr:hypothetical protein [Alphaproteobacteria bacterium]
MNPIIDGAVQCWGCPVFDRLFQVISMAAAAVYDKFVVFCMILFCVLFAFFVVSAVWKNIKGGADGDPFYAKSIRPVFINSLVAFAFLSLGVWLPRFVTTITFEPVAQITAIYTQSMLRMDTETINEKVTYQPMQMSDDGFYRPALRDTIILIMKTTITQFQAYMKLGIVVMNNAFSWDALLGIGALIKHIIMFFVGLYLFYGFFKLFVRFCFYFADVIIAMTFFAFFFPLSLTLVSFKGADAPQWMANLGKNVGTDQFKKVINAIIGLAAAVLTYTVIMVIIAKFFSAPGASTADLMALITNGSVFEADLDQDNLAQITLGSAIVLVYVLNYIYSQIPQVTNMVLGAFNVSADNKLGEQLADDAMKLTTAAAQTMKKIGATIINGGKKDDKAGGK